MAADSSEYSIELMARALAEAADAASPAADDGEIVAAYLQPLLEILGSNCAIFYGDDLSPLPARPPLRIHAPAKRELAAPGSITRQTQAYVRNANSQTVTSE